MIAIDPGVNGGFAWYEGETLHTAPMPEAPEDIVDLIEPHDVVVLERLVKYAGTNMPSSRMAAYAGNYGILRGVSAALRKELHLVTPQTWQGVMGVGTAKDLTTTQWKNKLKDKAIELHPGYKITLKTADAVLILWAATNASRDILL